jgi:hypothetical protein
MLILDLMVLDEFSEPFFCVSKPVKVEKGGGGEDDCLVDFGGWN